MNKYPTAQLILVVVVLLMAVTVSYRLFDELNGVVDIYISWKELDNDILDLVIIFSFLAGIWIFWAFFLFYTYVLRKEKERRGFLQFIERLNLDE